MSLCEVEVYGGEWLHEIFLTKKCKTEIEVTGINDSVRVKQMSEIIQAT